MNAPHEPVSAIDRDLSNLAQERVYQALMSVMQLTDGSRQGFVVAMAAHTALAGVMAASYVAMTKTPKDKVDPLDLAIAILQRIKDTPRGAS